MLRSMFSAISGLRAHQTKMDVTGNNIANVNTVGFKSSSTVFQDTLSQVVRAGGAPAAERGGTNPAQIGLGVKLAAITTNWTNGATQSTGRSTDFMIEGDGFFVTTGAAGEQLFTRAGSFDFDASGRLVTPDGGVLQGWVADADGVINANGPIGDLTVPYGQIVNPSATASGLLEGNLDAAAPVPTSVQIPTTMYDAQGVEQRVTYTITKTATDTWNLTVQNGGGPPLTLTNADGTPFDGNVTFDTAGTMLTPVGGIAFDPADVGWPGPVAVELGSISQFAGSSEVTAPEQDGYALGSLQSFQLSNDGTIMGVYSNGLRQPLGQLAMAAFNNPSGLEKAGNSSFRVGDNSGVAMIGIAGAGGRGVLTSGALEMSNVDLSEEFTSLIVAQRGFQANSRVITASDEILQDLVNLKR
ncbi:flagellar hook protein FlgE [Blastococcus saxobsidens]|uniref:Flagellar hook protein FlgE n=1 Tax=Blastococcus saxobsidens (strain DD2) TaxID=1146883 RepID=H6RSN7_BLASD|nr:flagellar hook protein FlgE [Blastococcus saxobsidens]CCG01788.1 Flagellar hook protein flgE [Blastococcus saxobsidens DD2]